MIRHSGGQLARDLYRTGSGQAAAAV